MLDRLTYKQRLFVEAYLGPSGGNATEAARVAGYRWPDKVGHQLLAKTRIRAAIDARLTEASLSTSEILARLSEQATGSIEHFVSIDPLNPSTYKIDLAKAKRLRKLHLVKRLKPTEFGVAIELYDSHSALVQLGKYRGLWDTKGQGDGAEKPRGVATLREFLHGDDEDEDGSAAEVEATG